MVKVTLNPQKVPCARIRRVYRGKGGWGKRGATVVLLLAAKKATVLRALTPPCATPR